MRYGRVVPGVISGLIGLSLAFIVLLASETVPAASDDNVDTALSLAELLRGARTVIAVSQQKINDPTLGNKGLTGDVVVEEAIKNTIKATGQDPTKVDPNSRQGRLLAALMKSIRNVMAANQDLINQPGTGFKGFVPAVFGRLVTEQFKIEAADQAEIKVTAPPDLVRNRKAFPDAFEKDIIKGKFMAPDWPHGQLYAEESTANGRAATRTLVPEYYGEGCLSCHGKPKGEIDITGYPKEGASLGDLGGVISITVYK